MAAKRKHSFLFGSLILMLGTVLVKLVGAMFKIPLDRVIGEEGLGYFDSAYLLFLPVYTLAIAGLPVAVSRSVAQNVAKGRFRDVKRIYNVAFKAFTTTGTIGTILIFVLAYPYSRYVHNPGMLYSALVMAPAIFLTCMMAIHRGYYEGLRNMIPTAASQVIEAIGKLVLGLLFANLAIKFGMSQFYSTGMVYGKLVESQEAAFRACLPLAAAGAMSGVTLGAFGGALFLSFYKRAKGDGITLEDLKNSPPPLSQMETFKALIKISIPVVLGSLILTISNSIDGVTIQRRLTQVIEANPTYLMDLYKDVMTESMENKDIPNFLFSCYHSYAITLYYLIPSLTVVFGVSAVPNVTVAWINKTRHQVKRSIEAVIRIVALVAAPCGMGYIFMSGPIMRLLYKGKGVLHIGPPLLSVLGVAAILVSIATAMNAILQAVGRADLPAKIILVGCVIKIAANYALVGVPWINIYGAPVGTVLSYAFMVVASYYFLRKTTKIRLNLGGVVLKPLVAGFLCAVSAWVTNSLLRNFISEKKSVLIAIGIAALIYTILLFTLKAVTKNDVLMLPKGEKIAKILEKLHWIE